MKYLEAFLKKAAISHIPIGIVPAKPAKGALDGSKGAFDGFAGASYRGTHSTGPVTVDQTANPPAEPPTGEVARILAVWWDRGIRDLEARRVNQGFNSVGEHLENLRRWQRRWAL